MFNEHDIVEVRRDVSAHDGKAEAGTTATIISDRNKKRGWYTLEFAPEKGTRTAPWIIDLHESDFIEPFVLAAARKLWGTIIDVRNLIASNVGGDTAIFHKKVAAEIQRIVTEDVTGDVEDNQGALDDSLLVLLRAAKFPLDYSYVLSTVHDGEIVNRQVIVGLTESENEDAAKAAMVAEVTRIVTQGFGQEKPDPESVKAEFFVEQSGVIVWGLDNTHGWKVYLIEVEETITSF